MKKYNIYLDRSDLINSDSYKTISFDNLNSIKEKLKKEILFFLNKLNIKKGSHIFIVGLGNDNYTADSVGPKTLKHIHVNLFIKEFSENNDTLVSALEPGVLGETGIKTTRIIESVVDEIKPDIVILIDSFVSDDINDLNKKIVINDVGINKETGILGIHSNINYDTLHIPVLVIGAVTAVEVKFSESDSNYIPYILSSKNVDDYVLKVSRIIGESLNEIIGGLE